MIANLFRVPLFRGVSEKCFRVVLLREPMVARL